jgi:protein-disulfide isomerase
MSPWVPRVLLALGLIALVSAIVSIAVGNGGPGHPAPIGGVNDVQRIFGGIRQDGAYLGSPDAPVTITVFNDIQCRQCADYEIDTIDPLVEEYARGDQVRLEFRHFSVGPKETTLAAIAAEAAGVQDRQWQYLDTFVRNEDEFVGAPVDEDILHEVAEAVPQLDVDQWSDDYHDPASEERVSDDATVATDLRLPAEPAVVVSGPAGQKTLIESPSQEEIEAAVAEVSPSS